MHTYLDYLQWIIEVGTEKLPRLLSFVQEETDLLVKYKDLLDIKPMPVHEAAEPTAEEKKLESQIVAAHASHAAGEHGAIGDGTILQLLRTAWVFFKDNPELLQFIMLLFSKKAAA